ncbi:MAG: hypothetical protein ACI9D5_002126 [Candidatus Endobugula sp.]
MLGYDMPMMAANNASPRVRDFSFQLTRADALEKVLLRQKNMA